ncbi:hypothetical protein JCM3775_003306 [Rhodotorula graminis]
MPRVTRVVAPLEPDSSPTSSSPSSRPSQAGPSRTRTVKPVTLASWVGLKPYDRPRPAATAPGPEPFVLGREPPPFPTTLAARSAFRRDAGTNCTPFQWRLYDLLLTVPPGSVTTYAQLATLLDSSARAVGSALRNNPFAPFVPCHRVIASTLYIGGFGGEWIKPGPGARGRAAAAKAHGDGDGDGDEGRRTGEKRELLRREGVEFDAKGFLRTKRSLWDGAGVARERGLERGRAEGHDRSKLSTTRS